MATLTVTLTPFRKSHKSILTGTSHYLEGTPTLAILDESSPVTEDTTVTGDEFLSDLAGASILSSVALTSPVFNDLVFDFDDSAASELVDIGSGNAGNKVLLYNNTGNPATSRLYGIGTLSATLNGDDVNDDIQFPNGLIDYDA